MKLIDIGKERDKAKADKRKKKKAANGPDSDCMTKGPDGTTYYKFHITYAYKGKNWTFDLWATSEKDAHKRVWAMKKFPVDIAQTLIEHARKCGSTKPLTVKIG